MNDCIDPVKKFTDIDFSCVLPACGGFFKKDTANIRRCGETKLNYFVQLLKKIDGAKRVIGEMDFMISENNSVFIVHLRNCSINNYGERKYKGVGTALINCAKVFVRAIRGTRIYLSAMTPFSTPLPQNHDIVEFYKKQGFTITSQNSYGTRMEWKNTVYSDTDLHVNVDSGSASASAVKIIHQDKELPFCMKIVASDVLPLSADLHETRTTPGVC